MITYYSTNHNCSFALTGKANELKAIPKGGTPMDADCHIIDLTEIDMDQMELFDIYNELMAIDERPAAIKMQFMLLDHAGKTAYLRDGDELVSFPIGNNGYPDCSEGSTGVSVDGFSDPIRLHHARRMLGLLVGADNLI